MKEMLTQLRFEPDFLLIGQDGTCYFLNFRKKREIYSLDLGLV
jgi:hypothetical protein